MAPEAGRTQVSAKWTGSSARPGLGSRDRLAPWRGERGQVRKGSAEAPGNLPKESIQGPGPRKGSTLRHQRIDER